MNILTILKENQKNGSTQVITGDESRFISIILINWSESHPEMRFQKRSNKELTRKMPNFDYLVGQQTPQFARYAKNDYI
jgi:hypothetical protein